jgi:hypothetical protein
VALLHLGLLYGLAGGDVVASLFAAGGQSSPAPVALALLFVVTRFVAIVVLPGFMGYRLVLLLFSLRRARGQEAGRRSPGVSTNAGNELK